MAVAPGRQNRSPFGIYYFVVAEMVEVFHPAKRCDASVFYFQVGIFDDRQISQLAAAEGADGVWSDVSQVFDVDDEHVWRLKPRIAFRA
ncbi:hypothetical protein D9M68_893060 [compost metagenome]